MNYLNESLIHYIKSLTVITSSHLKHFTDIRSGIETPCWKSALFTDGQWPHAGENNPVKVMCGSEIIDVAVFDSDVREIVTEISCLYMKDEELRVTTIDEN